MPQPNNKPKSVSLFDQMKESIANMSEEKRKSLGRVMRGEDEDDLLRREDVRQIGRNLRLSKPVPSPEYQKALSDVMRGVTNLEGVQQKTEVKSAEELTNEIEGLFNAARDLPCTCNVDENNCAHCSAWTNARYETKQLLSDFKLSCINVL